MKTLSQFIITTALCFSVALPALAQTPLKDGYAAFQNKDYVTARAQLEPLSNSGDKIAQYIVGVMHENGWGGFAKSKSEAFRLYKASSNQGFENAYEYLADMYYFGHGTPKNYGEAFNWYPKIAADKKSGHVLKRIGDIYDYGYGRPKNPSMAVVYYQKSADKNYSKGQISLGYMYEIGRGVEQNFGVAASSYRKAAEQGNALAVNYYRKAADKGRKVAQSNLATLYENGSGVPQSYADAMKWHSKAAAQDYARSMSAIGYYYEKGHGVAQSHREALSWYRKSAVLGYAEGQYNVGTMYYNGNGATKSRELAIVWIKKAAAQDYAKAKKALKQLGVE